MDYAYKPEGIDDSLKDLVEKLEKPPVVTNGFLQMVSSLLKSKVKQFKLWWWSHRTLEQHLKREAKGFTVKSERPLQLYRSYRESELLEGTVHLDNNIRRFVSCVHGKDIYAAIEVYVDEIELIFSINGVPRYRRQKNISAYETDGKLDLDKLRRDLGYFFFIPTLYKGEICGSAEAPALADVDPSYLAV